MLNSPGLFIAVAMGGAIGSVLRFSIATLINRRSVSWHMIAGFPLATLLVNVVGSFLIGLLYVFFEQRAALGQGGHYLRAFVIVGLLGGFTTFSTFSLETIQLLQSGLWSKAMLNIIGSVAICMVAAMGGMSVMR